MNSTLTAYADYRIIGPDEEHMGWVVVMKFGDMEVGEINLHWKLVRAPTKSEVDLAAANFLLERLFR